MPEVLLIDNDPVQLRVREAVLRKSGIAVCSAKTADEGLDLLRDPELGNSLRLIVTDHVMPGASGATFVRELRRFSPDVPVIVVTGLAEAEDEYEGLSVSFLNKPCPPEELIARVRAALQSKP